MAQGFTVAMSDDATTRPNGSIYLEKQKSLKSNFSKYLKPRCVLTTRNKLSL